MSEFVVASLSLGCHSNTGITESTGMLAMNTEDKMKCYILQIIFKEFVIRLGKFKP